MATSEILEFGCPSRADFFRNAARLVDGKASGVGLGSCSCIVRFENILLLLKLVADISLPVSRYPEASCGAC